MSKRGPLGFVPCGPAGITFPGPHRRISSRFEWHLFLGLRFRAWSARNDKNDDHEQSGGCAACQELATRHPILPTYILLCATWLVEVERHQLTEILSSAVVTVPSSSVQLNLNVPLSSTLA